MLSRYAPVLQRVRVSPEQRCSRNGGVAAVQVIIEVALAMVIAYGVVRYTNSEHPVWAAFAAVGHYETGSE
jgi:hypothetical protein